MRSPVPFLLFLLLGFFAAGSQPLSPGSFPVGFRVLKVWYTAEGDSIPLVLNLWYPAKDQGGPRTKLLDFTYNHLAAHGKVTDSLRAANIASLRRDIERWFGPVADDRWKTLTTAEAWAVEDAPFYDDKFPLILGRIRVFSTQFTNEYLASHGYVVCMINGVEDHPPDQEEAYHLQLSNEIRYYEFVREYILREMKITSTQSGLMGFSGSGFSQLLAPMCSKVFGAVALFESAVLVPGVGDILSRHKGYVPDKFKTPLLFLYNKQRFESTGQRKRYDLFVSGSKHLVLFDDESQHHWDFATEGAIAALYLNRNAPQELRLFRVMNELTLQFFDHYLKNQGYFRDTEDDIVVR